MKAYDDRIFLEHILESISHVRNFTAGVESSFHTLPEKWFAVLRALQIMSESTTRLSDATKAQIAGIDWHRIRGFRNVLVHDYLGDVDPEIVRKVIEIELPKLHNAVSLFLQNGK
ncbi:MAG: HepT-like ribonuclease domain-containing protein [Alphaproteobacteria bacterium]|nr:HepT-like ribonuclease domain-containing protein [Alphaproteobacteria bacterium]